MTTSNTTYLTNLHQLLNRYFNLAEIQDLCLRLNIDYESVPGDEKPSQIRGLLLGLGRNGRLPHLIAIVQQLRPHVDWPPLPDDFQLPESLVGETAVLGNQYHVYGDIVHGDKIAGDKIVYQGLSTEEVADLAVKLKHKDQPKVWDGRNPYLGLAAFQESDAHFFFGRESLVEELLVRVKIARFIVIAGPSGSGKSSVARAGLFHALREGRLDKSDTWLLATMQPKGDPLAQLASAIDRMMGKPDAGDYLRANGRTNPLALHKQIEPLLSDDDRQRCVILVDQFEETFTQTQEADRAPFIELLTQAAEVANGRITIVLSLRSDFVSHCARYPALRRLVSQQFQLVGTMDSPDLANAITRPAREVGAKIDPDLVSRIQADMKGEPGALPLMGFALQDLFEAEKTVQGEPMALTLAEYLQRGGIESALERHANKAFARFTAEQKRLARVIFSKLIAVGHGSADTRRTAVFSELVPAGVEGGEVTAVVQALAKEGVRLIIASGEAIANGNDGERTVTLAHEKLIDAWPWLRQLVDENREMIALQNQINDDAAAWAKEEDPGYLYRGGRLLQTEEKLELVQPTLDDLSQRFIQASLAQRDTEQQQARRRRLTSFGTLLLLLIVFAIAAVVFNRQSAANANIAAQALAQSLVANARALLSDRNISNQELAQARLLAVEGARLNQEVGRARDQTLSQGLLYTLAVEKPDIDQPLTLLTAHESSVESVAWNRDGSRLATASNDNTVIIWQANEDMPDSWEPLVTLEHKDWVWSVAWSRDGRLLASASANDTVIIWDTVSWQPLTTLKGHGEDVRSVAWNEAGSRLASASDDNTVIIWDTSNWEPLATLTDHKNNVVSVAWNRDGSRLASASYDDTVIIWDTRSWEPLATLTGHASDVLSVAWNEAGNRLATASSDTTVIIWQADEDQPDVWQPLTTLTDHTSSVLAVAWTRDGSHLATASDDNSVIIWDTTDWQPLTTLADHNDLVGSVAWNEDGSRLATGSFGEVIVWITAGWEPLSALTDHQGRVWSVAWNGDGRRLASAADDGRVISWQADEGQPDNWEPLITLTDHKGDVRSVAWNRDGSRLATASTDHTVIIWDTTNWQPLATLADHTASVQGVAWNKAGSRLATAAADHTVIIWDTTSWEPLTRLTGYDGWNGGIAWNEAGSRLAVASCGEYDAEQTRSCIQNEITIWDTATWERLTTLTEHTHNVSSLAWNAAGSRLASASYGEVIVWDTADWVPLTRLTDHNGWVWSVAWNTAGSYLASASADRTIIIWDTANWERLTTLTEHTEDVRSVAWNADGSYLASASLDTTIVVWAFPDFSALNCSLAGRNLSLAEWQQFLPGKDYRCTCDQWPAGEDAPVDAAMCKDVGQTG